MIEPLPPGPHRVAYLDPPWRFLTWNGEKAVPTLGADPYPTMTLEELQAIPLASVMAEDALLIMWTTSDQLANALGLGQGWGFTYKSLGPIWVKERAPSQAELFGDAPICELGMGYWFRQQAEVSLLFTRGSPSRRDAGVRQVVFEPRREHSRKPDEVRRRIERISDGPYLELFGRTQAPGWSVWGNDTSRFAAPR